MLFWQTTRCARTVGHLNTWIWLYTFSGQTTDFNKSYYVDISVGVSREASSFRYSPSAVIHQGGDGEPALCTPVRNALFSNVFSISVRTDVTGNTPKRILLCTVVGFFFFFKFTIAALTPKISAGSAVFCVSRRCTNRKR